MFDFIRRLLGMRGTAPTKAEAAVQDAAREPWLDARDRDAAAALAAAGYAAAPGPAAGPGSGAGPGAGSGQAAGKPDATPATGKRATPARGEYDRRTA